MSIEAKFYGYNMLRSPDVEGLVAIACEETANHNTYNHLRDLQQRGLHRGDARRVVVTSDGKKFHTVTSLGMDRKDDGGNEKVYLPGRLGVGINGFDRSVDGSKSSEESLIGRTSHVVVAANDYIPQRQVFDRVSAEVSLKMEYGPDTRTPKLLAELVDFYLTQGIKPAYAISRAALIFGDYPTFLAMTHQNIYGIRRASGSDVIWAGDLEGCKAIASENSGLSDLGGSFPQVVNPGRLTEVDAEWIRTFTVSPKAILKLDAAEIINIASPRASYFSREVWRYHQALGGMLAQRYLEDSNFDCLAPVPESGRFIAQGCAEESGIPVFDGIRKNRYDNKTPGIRVNSGNLSINRFHLLNPSMYANRRVVVVDNGILTGRTIVDVVKLLRTCCPKDLMVLCASMPTQIYDRYSEEVPLEVQKELVSYYGLEDLEKTAGVKIRCLNLDDIKAAFSLDPMFRDSIDFQRYIPKVT